MKKLLVLFTLSFVFLSCSNDIKDQSVSDLIEYNRTHTGYADSSDITFAIAHGITPDSAVVLRKGGRK